MFQWIPYFKEATLSWDQNPEGYDAERSWRRALLELAGPAAYAPFAEVCRAFRDGRPREIVARAITAFEAAPDDGLRPVPRAELVRLLREDLARLEPPGDSAP